MLIGLSKSKRPPLLKQIMISLLATLSYQMWTIDRSITPASCENFLKQWDDQPTELKFSGCKYQKGGQSNQLIANYEVKGTEAKIIETYLHQKFKMARLQRVCCIWEPRSIPGSDARYGHYLDRDGYDHEIVMGSGETLEKDWQKIPKFYVSVAKYLSDP
jgi:Domian of unknown function (DUF4952)